MHKTLVRKLTVAGLVGAVAMSAAARELTPEEALLRAGLFRSENTGIFKSRSANNTRLAHTVTLPELNSAAFYVFNYGNGNGYGRMVINLCLGVDVTESEDKEFFIVDSV